MITKQPHMQRCALFGAVLLLLAGFTGAVRADENYFGYTYGAETLPKGRSEIYQWVTGRFTKEAGRYRGFDFQTELEHGFTDRLQGSFYVNAVKHDIRGVPELADTHRTAFNGVQASLKYRLSSPFKDRFGFAVYVEPGYKRYSKVSGEREDAYFFETKLIVQKNFLDDTLVWAANLTIEPERAHVLAEDKWESELEVEYTTGLSYRFAPNWFLGLEGRIHTEYPNMNLGNMEHYGLFLGPNIHYGAEKWWFTVTALPQITGWPETRHGLQLDEHEKFELRVKVGINF